MFTSNHLRGSRLPFVAALALVAGACGETDRPRAKARSGRARAAAGEVAVANRTQTTIFDDAFRFTCSRAPGVGCSGVFPVRRAGGSGAGQPSRVALLSDGEASLRARVESLQKARRTIRIQALIFRADETGLFVADLLERKKAEGLDVRVIVDATSNLDWKTQWMYFDMKQHGVEVEGYEALYLEWLTAEIVPNDPLRPNKRFHDKMWIVDGEDAEAGLAIVGGLNLANEYFRVDPTPINRWRDQDLLVRGPVVRDVVRAFDRNYDFFKSIKDRLPSAFNPDNAWRLARGARSKVGAVRTATWRSPALVSSIERVLAQAVDLRPSSVVSRFLQSRPRLEETYIGQAYLDLIGRARSRILIANAYFVPSRAVIAALKAAARRGVEVVVVTNSPATNDIGPVATVSRWLYADLLSAAGNGQHGGITIREWAGAPFGEGTLHAKFGVFDGVEAIVGSYNLDPRSERLNSETALAFQSPELATALETWFTREYVAKSVEVTPAQAASFRRPNDADRVFELVFALPLRSWL
ncbi:MAG: phosphatidylserine/phosphatidylglycerophosphate/cardiolipin synthase family protein [Deltaproteobacteria bacterium]|nr:phosphatidylserine/phosphatidylglycerophosphate/cardiolipin synthase family protein [Deltaproteobacteria bacterium]